MKGPVAILVTIAALAAAPGAFAAGDELAFADGLFARGLHELALREYLAIATNAAAGSRDIAWYRAGECHRATGQAAAAAAAYQTVVREFPDSRYADRAAFRLARSALDAGDAKAAADLLKDVAFSEPERESRAAILYTFGDASLRANRTKDAERAFRALLTDEAASPFAPFARVGLADLLADRDGADDEVRDLLERAAAEGEGRAVGAEALYRLGARLFARGAFDASAEAFARLRARYAGDPIAEDARRPAAWALYRAGRWEDALPLVASDSTADGLYLKANVLRAQQRNRDARAVYARLIEDHPKHERAVEGRYEAALAALADGDAKAALALIDGMPSRPALDADVAWLRAEAAQRVPDADRAREAYDEFARRYPADPRADAARLASGRLLQARDKHAEAAAAFRALAESTANAEVAADAWYAAAYSHNQLQQPAEALAAWQAALAAVPEARWRDEALFGIATVRAEGGERTAALEALERMLREAPTSRLAPQAHLLMGTLLEETERYDVAEYHYRMAAKKSPDAELARRVEFRRVGLLQRTGRNEEAAGVLDSLVRGGDTNLPAPLLDWSARWHASQSKWEEALRAARSLAGSGDPGAWGAIGGAIAGKSLEELGRTDEARAAYAAAIAGGLPTREVREAALAYGKLAESAKELDAAQAAFTKLAEAATADDELSLRAEATAGLGRVMEARGDDDAAARYFLGVAVLYDHPTLVPEALVRAAAALGRLGRAADQQKVLDELRTRYPEYAGDAP